MNPQRRSEPSSSLLGEEALNTPKTKHDLNPFCLTQTSGGAGEGAPNQVGEGEERRPGEGRRQSWQGEKERGKNR